MKTKPFESREQTATGTHEPFQKKAKQSGWSRPAGMPDIKAVAAKLLDRSRRKEVESRQRETAASSAGGGASSAIATIVDRPLPIRFPPWNASLEDMHKWNLERRRIDKLVGKGHFLARSYDAERTLNLFVVCH